VWFKGEIGDLMNIKEIKELIEAVSEYGITELEVERTGVKVKIKKAGQPVILSSHSESSLSGSPGRQPDMMPSGAEIALNTSPPSEKAVGVPQEDLLIVRSPIVGTFYRASSPTAEAFVKTGDMVESGRVLCIIEAMKLMNEIEAEVGGEIVKIYVENGESVEFGQALFGIRPSIKG
jgi:acetyl-CoA carboxylase biotin carboxyl carrier protein